MKPQHLLLTALAGLGLGGGLYWFSAGGQASGKDKPAAGKGAGGSKGKGKGNASDVVITDDFDWSSIPKDKWNLGGWDSDHEKFKAVLDYHNKTKKKIALAPGVSFDEQGNVQTNMPILVANPYPVM